MADLSTAIGADAEAVEYRSTAVGQSASASGGRSTALGDSSQARGRRSTALGQGALAGDSSRIYEWYDNIDEYIADFENNPPSPEEIAADPNVIIAGEAYAIAELEALRATNTLAANTLPDPVQLTERATAVGFEAAATAYRSTAIGANAAATGDESTALGANAAASAKYSTALGYRAAASGERSTAVGRYSMATDQRSTALGNYARAIGKHTTALGQSALAGHPGDIYESYTSVGKYIEAFGADTPPTAENIATYPHVIIDGEVYAIADLEDRRMKDNLVSNLPDPVELVAERATAVGSDAAATAERATAVGAKAAATAERATALGYRAEASATRTTAVGDGAQASAQRATALGRSSHATAERATAVGQFSLATGELSTALGHSTRAFGEHATALGQGALAGKEVDIYYLYDSVDEYIADFENYPPDADEIADGPFVFIGDQVYAIADLEALRTAGTLTADNLPTPIPFVADRATAVGSNAAATADRSTAVGYGAEARAEGSATFGAGAIATRANQYVFGVPLDSVVIRF